ncbi:MAG: hypothetical protein KGL40_05180 [Rhodocyclaceae bacterium]|nr:hypothetical protein [Rhodocyclaceae bacterium]
MRFKAFPWRQIVCVLACAGVFVYAQERLEGRPRLRPAGEIGVALPLFIQVALAGGDRYFAANIAAVRALVTDPGKMTADEFHVLARVQEDVSWLNPYHEDNYYTAASVLPWYGQLESAQVILRRAMLARPFDYQPGFFYGFDLLHFRHDPAAASAALREAASRMPDDSDDRMMLENMAARWLDRVDDLDMAIEVVEAMAKGGNRKDFRDYLKLRAQRLRMLKEVRTAAAAYRQQTGQPVRSLDQLVAARLLKAVPVDPFGMGFTIDANGRVFLKN